MTIQNRSDLRFFVDESVKNVKITDLHTHLFSECFGELFSYDADDLLTYHYLIEEALLASRMPAEKYWRMGKKEQAEFIWKTLFIDSIPISESAKSVLTIFKAEGLDINRRDFEYYRSYFASINKSDYVDRIFDIVGLDCVIMTNDPFDQFEASVWKNAYIPDDRFKTALRLDVLLNTPQLAYAGLKNWGYGIETEMNGLLTCNSVKTVKRFLCEQIDLMDALYCAASLPCTFSMANGTVGAQIMAECILPACLEKNIPLALMIGVTRNVNPRLRHAGSSVGKNDITVLHHLCANFPENKFLVTMLARENQHELTATGRIFNNLLIFGCWWFLNNPSLEKELTEMRIEMLGNAFVAQHSDACIMGHLISKWQHFKPILSDILHKI